MKKFESLLTTIPDYWKTANAFDTMIDFLEYCSDNQTTDAAKAADWLIKKKGYEPAGTWFDDYGWWTIATGRAAGKTFFAEAHDQLDAIKTDCWKRFTNTAPRVWEFHKAGTFTDCRPAISGPASGGVWNGYWKGTVPPKDWPGPTNGDPTTGTLLGKQNTVTNAVYLLSAQVVKDDAADQKEFNFLDAWFNVTAPVPQRLWWQPESGVALVRERMPYYWGGKHAPGFDPQWAWTGDQGLMIGALVGQAMRETDPKKHLRLIERAEYLLYGVHDHLVDQKKVLTYWTQTGTVPDNDYGDYSTGSGVFWRYVLRVWEAGFLKQPLSQKFHEILEKSATLSPPSWPTYTPPQWVRDTNDLAVLVAAHRMLK
jgi:hypothetical protein